MADEEDGEVADEAKEPEGGSEAKTAKGRPPRECGPVQCDGEKLFSTVQAKVGVVLVLVHCWMHYPEPRVIPSRTMREPWDGGGVASCSG